MALPAGVITHDVLSAMGFLCGQLLPGNKSKMLICTLMSLLSCLSSLDLTLSLSLNSTYFGRVHTTASLQ